MSQSQGTFETRADAAEGGGAVKVWKDELRKAQHEEKDWRERAQKVIDRYRDDARRDKATSERFNILWANTEILRAHLFPSSPNPDVRRRNDREDDESAGREAARALERALSFYQDTNSFDRAVDMALIDMLLTGRGVIRVAHDPEIEERRGQIDPSDPLREPPTVEVVTDQQLRWEYVHWRDFAVSPARSWSEVRWVAFRHFLTRDQLREFFDDEIAEEIPLDFAPESGEEQPSNVFKQSEIWEIWDKQNRERVWVNLGFERLIETEPDPLELDGFWPMPAPLYAVPTPNSMIPVPEFTLYQDQARELDRITTRIKRLVEQMKRRGLYAADQGNTLKQLEDADDNQFFPVEDFSALMEKGGLAQAFQQEDLSQGREALQVLYQQRETLLNTIFQVTGISDIVRGQGQGNETATAQRLKGQFAGTRLSKRQLDVERWLKEAYEVSAEVIAEHWQPQILQQITGVELTEEVAGLLSNEQLRGFRLDVEIEATAGPEAEAQRQSRIEFVTTVSQFLQQALPAAQQLPQAAPFFAETIQFLARSFKAGRGVEDSIQQFSQQMEQLAQQSLQDQQSDPQEQRAQLEVQEKQVEIQQKQLELQKTQQEMIAERQRQIVEQQEKALELERQGQQHAAQTARENMKVLVDSMTKLAQTGSNIDVREAESMVKNELAVQREQANERFEEATPTGRGQASARGSTNGSGSIQ